MHTHAYDIVMYGCMYVCSSSDEVIAAEAAERIRWPSTSSSSSSREKAWSAASPLWRSVAGTDGVVSGAGGDTGWEMDTC